MFYLALILIAAIALRLVFRKKNSRPEPSRLTTLGGSREPRCYEAQRSANQVLLRQHWFVRDHQVQRFATDD